MVLFSPKETLKYISCGSENGKSGRLALDNLLFNQLPVNYSVIWLSNMSKSSKWLRDFVGGFLALAGAGLVSWQAVLAYYLIIGRVQVGEEHPTFVVIAILFIIGIFLIFAGYTFSKPSSA